MDKNSSQNAIEITSLTVAYQEQPVLWDINLNIPKGVIHGIIGPNGAGKSTLIKAILGIVRPIAGQIRVFGDEYKKQRKRVAYVPQRTSVDWDFPSNVLDVVLMGSYGHVGWVRRPGKKEKKMAIEALDKLGLMDLAHRQISELSGGQQQRTFLARSLVQKPDIYLMDEPFAGIDAKTEKTIISFMKELKDQEKTLIVVHHDLQTVKEYFDWLTLLNTSIIAHGPTQEVFSDGNIEQAYGGQIQKDHSLV
ncbi:MAG: zinc ABC transporter ATP-binding protein [bacterium]|nr:MAG: zinc ABC transporter ATP-binding protein [bacterium]